ncbi:MAG: hypothetical protein ABR915_07730 [Thermoguttaceae bacterium]|jgi:hypothetical protein
MPKIGTTKLHSPKPTVAKPDQPKAVKGVDLTDRDYHLCVWPLVKIVTWFAEDADRAFRTYLREPFSHDRRAIVQVELLAALAKAAKSLHGAIKEILPGVDNR